MYKNCGLFSNCAPVPKINPRSPKSYLYVCCILVGSFVELRNDASLALGLLYRHRFANLWQNRYSPISVAVCSLYHICYDSVSLISNDFSAWILYIKLTNTLYLLYVPVNFSNPPLTCNVYSTYSCSSQRVIHLARYLHFGISLPY
jgi:hypothetical protein